MCQFHLMREKSANIIISEVSSKCNKKKLLLLLITIIFVFITKTIKRYLTVHKNAINTIQKQINVSVVFTIFYYVT